MLSNKQKFILSDLARQAWKLALAACGRPEDDFVSERDFRHQEVARAVAKDGLCCCDQRDYKLVEAHFLALLGRDVAAQRAQARAATEPKRQAEAVLCQELARFHLPASYAEAICRRQYKCGLSEASPGQTWRLVYTIRNRGARLERREGRTPVSPQSPNPGKLTYVIKKS